MLALWEIILTIFSNPRVEAFLIVGITSYIKKIMSENTEAIYLDDEPEAMVKTEQPLWMPAGSVRAIITLILVLVSCVAFAFPNIQIPEAFHVLTIGAVTYYVGYRSTVKK